MGEYLKDCGAKTDGVDVSKPGGNRVQQPPQSRPSRPDTGAGNGVPDNSSFMSGITSGLIVSLILFGLYTLIAKYMRVSAPTRNSGPSYNTSSSVSSARSTQSKP